MCTTSATDAATTPTTNHFRKEIESSAQIIKTAILPTDRSTEYPCIANAAETKSEK